MSSLLYIPSKKTVRIRPDFSQKPITIELPRDRRFATFVLAIVCFWGAIGTVGTFGIPAVLTALTPGLLKLLPFALAFISTGSVLYFGWMAMRLYVSNDTITIDQDEACLMRIQLFSKTRCCEPVSAYTGLQSRSLSTQVNNKAVTYQIVEMVHQEAEKTLPIFIDKGTSLPIHIVQDLSASLGLKIITNGQ